MSSEKLHVPSLLQLILSGMGLLTLMPASAGLLLLGLISLSGGQEPGPLGLAWVSAFAALLLVPSIILALQRLMGYETRLWQVLSPRPVSLAGMLTWPLLVGAGAWIAQTPSAALLLPPIQLMVVVIPLWWLLEIAGHGLPSGSLQRRWGLVSFGILISPIVIITFEAVVMIVVVILVALYLSSQPGTLEQLTLLLQRLANSQANPEVLMRALRPVLQQPPIIATIIGMVAGVVPLIEELLKPLGLWFFARRKLTPAEGFTGGMLCGAIFALLESLVSLSSTLGGDWVILAVGRFGTGMLHVAAAGLMGWGLASAWSEGRYLRLAVVYLVSSALHGIWNIFGILIGVAQFAHLPDSSLFGRLSMVAPAALLFLMVILFLLLTGANRRLKSKLPESDAVDKRAPDTAGI